MGGGRLHADVEKWWKVVNNSEQILVGEFVHSVDAKGRVAVPNPFRKKLNLGAEDKLVLARGPNLCIEGHTVTEWAEHVDDTMGGMPLYEPRSRRLRRTRLARAAEVELDGQGRILVPRNLKDMAGITGEAVFIGVGPFFEIWEPGRYQQYFGEADRQYDDDLVELDEQGMRRGTRAGSRDNTGGRSADDGQVRGDVPRTGDGR